VVLFFKETSEYLTTKLVSELALDTQKSDDAMILVSFNITMMDLKCDYVQVDTVSVLGNNQNVTKVVKKVPLDGDGVARALQGRNRKQNDVQMPIALHDKAVTESIEELHERGEDAVSLDDTTLAYALNEHDLVFVDFYASWCSHCKALAPTWEVMAKVMSDAARKEQEADEDYDEKDLEEAEKLDVPVFVGKIDCVTHHTVCQQHSIQAYPTLRLFFSRAGIASDYHGQRTVMDMIQWLMLAEGELERVKLLTPEIINPSLEQHLNMTAEEKHWAESLNRTRHHHQKHGWDQKKHPGCQISGKLLLNRAPGNFYIQAYSPYHDLVPHMTNVSHEIHSLVVSPSNRKLLKRHQLPVNFEKDNRPFDGNVYVTEHLHEAYHHYIKLVSVNGDEYQVMQSTQLAQYRSDQVPEAKFIIDLAPIAVQYRLKKRPLYEYISSLLAIIGGTFTVVGLIESAVGAAARGVSRRRQHKGRK
jgi:thiol-disulfide isomerase/thioredoxin